MIICHCLSVTDRDLQAACDAGADDVAGVERLCGAGSDCGGCRPLVQAILSDEIRRRRAPVFTPGCGYGAAAVGSPA